ncbi:hypothetical protein V7S43_009948 [Phytophthora oleae]|uniref:Uncharacterized protein n=1 Tax=Phytophthora oleae TaxID=2107226 RepID=A0ABD3FDH4_9STRA
MSEHAHSGILRIKSTAALAKQTWAHQVTSREISGTNYTKSRLSLPKCYQTIFWLTSEREDCDRAYRGDDRRPPVEACDSSEGFFLSAVLGLPELDFALME